MLKTYNDTTHRLIKMKGVDAKLETYFDFHVKF